MSWLFGRINNMSAIDRLRKIIDFAYEILTQKLVNGRLNAVNEASFQLEFGVILRMIGELYEFKIDDKFHLEFETYLYGVKYPKSDSNKARVDILLEYRSGTDKAKAVIELKFFKKENHREPNNRYDIFKDLENLEIYKENNEINLCYLVVGTDHAHYVSQEIYSSDTADFDCRDNHEYVQGKTLSYNTEKPYGEDIVLRNSYVFKWDKLDKYSFLKLEVK